jgi:hypothetical protein
LGPNDRALQKIKKEWLDQTGHRFIFGIYRLCKFQKYGQLECWTPNANGVFPRFPKTFLQAALYSTMPHATVHQLASSQKGCSNSMPSATLKRVV